MNIENYEITPNGEIITFRRHYIEESGKKDCGYALWQDKETKHLVFGLINSTYTHGVGISVNDHYQLILNHVQKIIKYGHVNVTYKYIPAPSEPYGDGFVSEVLPASINTSRDIPTEVISQLEKLIIILEEYREVL